MAIDIASPGGNATALFNALRASLGLTVPYQVLSPSTVSTLPGAPAAGTYAYVTDGDSSLAWGATVINSGSGATKYLVWYNGAHWTVVGK